MMADAPLWSAAKAVAEISLPDLEQYCRLNPPRRDMCATCGADIVSTPWLTPNGTFYMAGGGWMHETTELSPCGPDHPYRFAEPGG